MTMTSSLEKAIEKIPGEEGWWKGAEIPMRVADEMLARGIPEDSVLAWINDIFWAAASEYGN